MGSDRRERLTQKAGRIKFNDENNRGTILHGQTRSRKEMQMETDKNYTSRKYSRDQQKLCKGYILPNIKYFH